MVQYEVMQILDIGFLTPVPKNDMQIFAYTVRLPICCWTAFHAVVTIETLHMQLHHYVLTIVVGLSHLNSNALWSGFTKDFGKLSDCSCSEVNLGRSVQYTVISLLLIANGPQGILNGAWNAAYGKSIVVTKLYVAPLPTMDTEQFPLLILGIGQKGRHWWQA